MYVRSASFLLAILVGVAGCKSIKSTMLTRDDSNTSWQTVEHLDGVPITLKVPTHLEVTVIERHYLTRSVVSGVTQIDYVKVPAVIRGVNQKFIETSKIFTVDLKRPAAGTAKWDMQIDENKQYFKSLKNDIDDQTIARVTDLIDKLAPGGLFKQASAGDGEDNVITVDSTVAYKVFELDAPDFELQLTEFLNCHVNKAHDAWVMPPGVEKPQRVGLTASPEVDPLLCPECMTGAQHSGY